MGENMKKLKMLGIVFMSLLLCLVSVIYFEQINVSAKKANTYKLRFDNTNDYSNFEAFNGKALKKGNTFYVTASTVNDFNIHKYDTLDDIFSMNTTVNGSKYKIKFGSYKAEGKVGSKYLIINGKKEKLKAKVLSNGHNKILVPLDIVQKIYSNYGEYTVDSKKKIIRYKKAYYTTYPRFGVHREIVVRTYDSDFGVKNQKEYDLAMARVLDIKKSLNKVPFDKYMEGYLNGNRAKEDIVDFTEKDWEEYYGYKEAESKIGDLVKAGLSKKQVKEIYRVNEALDYFYNPNEFKYNTTNKYSTSYQSLYELLCQKKRSVFNENYLKEVLLHELGYKQYEVRFSPVGFSNNKDLHLQIKTSRNVYVFIHFGNHYFYVS